MGGSHHHILGGRTGILKFHYAAKSWSKNRRVVYKIELRKTEEVCELFPVYTFIVTNRDDDPKEIVRLYCKRGNMENFIKESKNEFGFPHMCSHEQITKSSFHSRSGI